VFVHDLQFAGADELDTLITARSAGESAWCSGRGSQTVIRGDASVMP